MCSRFIHAPTLMIVDVNECLSSTCGNNATCNNTEGSFICSCKQGFEGNGLNCSGKIVLYLLSCIPISLAGLFKKSCNLDLHLCTISLAQLTGYILSSVLILGLQINLTYKLSDIYNLQ
jgi:hypothetical protein